MEVVNRTFIADELIIVYFNNEYYFRGKNICKILEFPSKIDTIIYDTKENQKKILNVEGTEDIYLNQYGVFSLLMKSIYVNKHKFYNWILDDVIYKERYKFDDFDITNFTNKNVLYLLYIGYNSNNYYIKFGITCDINRRFKEHSKHFINVKILKLYETDKNNFIEKKLSTELSNKNMMSKITNRELHEMGICNNLKLDSKQTEIFTIKQKKDIMDIYDIIDKLINHEQHNINIIPQTKQISIWKSFINLFRIRRIRPN